MPRGYRPAMLRTTTLIAALVALGGLAACGDEGGGGANGGLQDALDAVSAGPASKKYFAFTDIATIGDTVDLPREGDRPDPAFMRWSLPVELGAPAFAQRAFGGSDATRID